METRPGTVTFLFTDIEGSTRLWERHASSMSVALARHDKIVRAAIERHGGQVFKTVGDAFCANFRTATDGVASALNLEREILDEVWDDAPIVVRCALHAGSAEERDGDYFGPTLNRVARLLAAAHGGQVLLSQAAAALTDEVQPQGTTLLDLGLHRLRDLDREEHIFQLVHPNLPRDFLPIQTLRARHDNIPPEKAAFIGRDRESAELGALLLDPSVRLVTVTGAGGCGKTRLAVHVAGKNVEKFADGVCFVPLATITNLDLVAPAIAQALHLREEGKRSIEELLCDYVRDKSLLLVLDNFEQVVQASSLVSELLNASKLKALVTSREPLRLYGEREYPLPVLALPKLGDTASVSLAAASRLFVDRARAADPRFDLTEKNARPIAEICKRLDGLPLAIELAAARVRLLSPEAMLDRLESSLDMLTGGARDLPERQRTMRAAIDWGYTLLDESDQALFRRLGVFSGGFTIDAAEEVCTRDASDDVLSGVASLLSKSLVSEDDESPHTDRRFRMLETVREYALERLESVGEVALMQRRHTTWSVRLAEHSKDEVFGHRQLESLARCEDEHDNFRAALAWLAERDGTESLRLAVALAPFWFLHGHRAEGRRWLAHGLAAAVAPTDVEFKGEALLWSGLLTDDWRAKELLEQADGVAAEVGDTALRGRARSALGWAAIREGRISDGVSNCREAVELLRTTTDRWGLANALHFLGHAQADETGLESARPAWEESLQLFRELGDGWNQAPPLKDLGLIASRRGDYETAAGLYEESLALSRDIGDKGNVADTLMRLGELAMFAGQPMQAVDHFQEALLIARDLENKTQIFEGLMRHAEVSEFLADYPLAQWLLEEALEIARELKFPRLIAAALHNLVYVELQNGDTHRAERMLRECTGIHRALGRDLEVALCLAAFGALALAQGRCDEATRLFGASAALRGGADVMLYRTDRLEFVVGEEARLSSLREALGDASFSRAWEEGSQLAREEALSLADRLAMPVDGRSVQEGT